jgi:hypothetical protein
LQVGELRLVHGPVGLGDVEEPVEHVLEELRLLAQDIGDLAGVSFEALGGALGEVEQGLDPRVLGIRHLDDALEGLDLVADHHAVRFRHLGRERHEAGGEDEVARRRSEGRPLPVDQNVPRHAPEQGPDGPAERQPDPGPAELAPNRMRHEDRGSRNSPLLKGPHAPFRPELALEGLRPRPGLNGSNGLPAASRIVP